MSNSKTNIPKIFLCGDTELAEAIGISDRKTLKLLREMGMPRTSIGRCFLYDPDKIRKWINDMGVKQMVK